MVNYESDSSGAEDVETGVTLGYACKEPTGDDFSQLGGQPTWLDDKTPPGGFAKCKVCNGLINALLQLHGDLPDRYAGHERRLYLFGCRRKACMRKEGSIRGYRYSKVDQQAASKQKQAKKVENVASPAPSNLGSTLFGVSSSTATSSNPFATKPASTANPFAATSMTASTTSTAELSQTFAEKAKIGTENKPKSVQGPVEPWPETSSFPASYPAYFIDADKEFLDPEPVIPQQARVVDIDEEASGSGFDDKSAFESTMDKTFQKFADRLSQNPEQILRYEVGGQPLLYSKTDAIGRLWPRVPRCSNCGSQRHFELQLTPQAIIELEAEDVSLEGMEWGTVILAVCAQDCEGWNEEWIGVQWEEVTGKKA